MNAGVQLNVPEVLDALTVNVAPAVIALPDAVNERIGSPSGSAADTGNVISDNTVPLAVAGAVTTGCLSSGPTVIAVVADPVSVLDATNVTLNDPL